MIFARSAAATAILVVLASSCAQAQSLQVLHRFTYRQGTFVSDGPALDGNGNLFGTSGTGRGKCGCGSVFEIAADGSYSLLYSFTGNDGSGRRHYRADGPVGGVVRDTQGNLYGTTREGGDYSLCFQEGCGSVFKLDTNGRAHDLHDFKGGDGDGEDPRAGLAIDGGGNVYGVTSNLGPFGGTLFRITQAGAYETLHSFMGIPDGEQPLAKVLRDDAGNLYGTTFRGGRTCAESNGGCGTVFKLAPDGTYSILFAFPGGHGGAGPTSSLSMDAKGNLYGTTSTATADNSGVAFEIAPGGTETVLHEFVGGADGEQPSSGLLLHPDGNLYGTTMIGGEGECYCGLIYRITRHGRKSNVHSFHVRDGANPSGDLVADADGRIYGATMQGGRCKRQSFGCGVIYRLDLNGASPPNRRPVPRPSSPRWRERS
ncbi:MAG: hypothetical protein JOZ72_08775 [Alphaproteobacteria bacterium]|nr:hypothetical protein [Alphaproteobacteria bacterium]